MNTYFNLLRIDYLQRARSYNYILTLLFCIGVACTFVPAPDANYATFRVDQYVGQNTSAWIGMIMTIMSIVTFGLFGYYSVSGAIRRDVQTGVGQIVATTPTSSFKYLLFRTFSNFVLLLTMLICTILVAAVLTFVRGADYPFNLIELVTPFVLYAIPAMWFVASASVVFEVIFNRIRVVNYIAYFIVFVYLLTLGVAGATGYSVAWVDPLGAATAIHDAMQMLPVNVADNAFISIGYTSKKTVALSYVKSNSLKVSSVVVASRIMWIFVSLIIIGGASFIFHRFDTRAHAQTKKPLFKRNEIRNRPQEQTIERLNNLPQLVRSNSIFPLIKSEFKMLLRSSNIWLMLLTIILMIAQLFAPIVIVYTILLPIVLFLQVTRISNLSTSEIDHRIHLFTFASFQPIRRLMLSKFFAAVVFLILVVTPFLIRMLLSNMLLEFGSVILGVCFLISVSTFFGLIFRTSKVFEIVFLIATYLYLNAVPFVDYLNAIQSSNIQMLSIGCLTVVLYCLSILIRRRDIQNV